MSDEKRKCPYCDSSNIEKVVDKSSFSGPIYINKCKNCGKYFVPTSKSNEIYCKRSTRL